MEQEPRGVPPDVGHYRWRRNFSSPLQDTVVYRKLGTLYCLAEGKLQEAEQVGGIWYGPFNPEENWFCAPGVEELANPDPARPNRDIGTTGTLYDKYTVVRRDGKPISWAFVIEGDDPNGPVAMKHYVRSARSSGLHDLADKLEDKLRELYPCRCCDGSGINCLK